MLCVALNYLNSINSLIFLFLFFEAMVIQINNIYALIYLTKEFASMTIQIDKWCGNVYNIVNYTHSH